MAAPRTRERTAPRGDQRDRAHAVMLAPDVHVGVLIDRGAIGEGLAVQVGDHRPWLGAHDLARVVAEGDALNDAELARSVLEQVRYELLERQLAFADGDDI